MENVPLVRYHFFTIGNRWILFEIFFKHLNLSLFLLCLYFSSNSVSTRLFFSSFFFSRFKIFLKSNRSSRSHMFFFKIGVLRKHLCWSFFLIELEGFLKDPFKKRLQHRCFPVKSAKFLEHLFFTKHVWWLVLDQYILPRVVRLVNGFYIFHHTIDCNRHCTVNGVIL